MKIGASIDGDLNAIATEILQEAEAAVTRGVFAAGRGLRDDWRGQVRASGLGTRLANSVRQADFPRSGTSLRAASLVWTKAPDILHAFDGGVLIRGKDGLWLAIPLPKQGAASDAAIDTHLESHLIDPQLLRSDDFDGFVGRRQEALLGLIEAATGKAIYRGAATDEPVEDMIEDEAEGLEAAE